MNAATLIAALGGDPRTGMCRCPAHDDHNPSLHVRDGDKGVIFKCRAGCSQEKVIEALKRRGAWPIGRDRSLMLPAPKSSAAPDDDTWPEALAILRSALTAKAPKPEDYFRGRGIDTIPKNAMMLPAKCWHLLQKRHDQIALPIFPAVVLPIVNERKLQGALVTMLTRDGKENLADRRDKNIRRIFGTKKGGYVQLGELDPDKPLIVAEGVEDVLSAMQLSGCPAGVAALGSLKDFAVPPCSEVIIAADNDGPGREGALALADRLKSIGGKVCIRYPGQGSKDWNQALRNGTGQKQWQRAEDDAADDDEKDRPRRGLALSMEDFMRFEFPERNFLLRPVLTTRSVNMIHAARGQMKTFLALSTAYAVATGRDLLGWQCERKARVLYVDGELPGAVLKERLRMLGPVTPELLFLSREMLDLANIMLPDLATTEGRDWLDKELEKYKPELIVLDSISTLMRSGEENDARDWAGIQDWTLKHRFRGRAIIFIHHEGRSGNPRGTTKREDTMDTVLRLKQRATDNEEEIGTALELTHEKTRGYYGVDAAPMHIWLDTKNGIIEWRHKRAQQENLEKLQAMLDEGMKQKDIAKELGVSPPMITKMKRKLQDQRDAA